jgi:hypothetical protein
MIPLGAMILTVASRGPMGSLANILSAGLRSGL